MIDAMKPVPLPHPDDINRRIEACKEELRALNRLLRTAQYARDAEEARVRRLTIPIPLPPPEGGPTDAAS
jgi:hypothetical protein